MNADRLQSIFDEVLDKYEQAQSILIDSFRLHHSESDHAKLRDEIITYRHRLNEALGENE